MAKKRKGKAKKDKIPQYDKKYYEATIVELNQKLARLRVHVVALDDTNIGLKEKLRTVTVDRADVAAHLERRLNDRNSTITELEQQNVTISRLHQEENSLAEKKIQNLEQKYKTTHDHLTSEIKLLAGKLSSLDEFRLERDALLARFDDQEIELKERDRAHGEDLFNMQQKAVVEKDALKKEVQAKLQQVSEDFTRSSEIRNAGYTRRLIRENITLQKQIDEVVLSLIRLQQTFNNQQSRFKEMVEHYAALDRIKNELIQNSHNKLKIIEGLTENYERLKEKYIEAAKYRDAYQKIIQDENCAYFQFKDASKRIAKLKKRIELLKHEKANLFQLHHVYESEIEQLRDTVRQIKNTMLQTVKALQSTGRGPEHTEKLITQRLQRKDLLMELIEIISSHSEKLPSTTSIMSVAHAENHVYKPGRMGLLRAKPRSLIDIFKPSFTPQHHSKDIISAFWIEPKDRYSYDVRTIRSVTENIMLTDWGTPLYVSSMTAEETPEANVEEPSAEELSIDGVEEAGAELPQEEGESDESLSNLSVRRSRLYTTMADARAVLATQHCKGLNHDDSLRPAPKDKSVSEDEDEYEINLFY